MTARTPAQAIADAVSALVHDHDLTGLLAQLVQDCAELLPADAAALLVRGADGTFELLSATSHRVRELELFQAQRDAGPCVDAARSGAAVSGVGADEIEGRWHDVGREIVAAGFLAVHAFPLIWRGRALGGLTVFAADAEPMEASSLLLAQSFADFATLAIVQPTLVGDEDLVQQITDALEGRVVIEQAKGVLAYVVDLDMAAAYVELQARAEADGSTLSDAARNVIREARSR